MTVDVAVGRLAEEYQQAEVPTEDAPLREGDEYIARYHRIPHGPVTYVIGVAWEEGSYFGVDPRVTNRSALPLPERRDELAAHLDGLPGGLTNGEIAENLRATGWVFESNPRQSVRRSGWHGGV